MSTTGRAVDLLNDWREHPADCTVAHPWGEDASTCGLTASDVLDLLRETLGVVPAQQLEEANAELARLRTRVGQLTAAHAEAERLRALAGGPHSRACGIRPHEHGSSCAPDCPTCHGPLHPTRGDQ